MNPNKVTGFVLAGGKSSRMGEDKSLMKLNGKTMVEYSIEVLKMLCSQVIVSSNQLAFDFTGCQVWPDEGNAQAPIVGIYSCLKRSNTEYNVILSCDMPLIRSELINFLLKCSGDYDITVPMHENGIIEPLCGIYKKSAISQLERSITDGNLSLKECIHRTRHHLVNVEELLASPYRNQFKNINTPDDFKEISSYLHST